VTYWTGIATATTADTDQRADGWQASSRVDIALARRVQTYVQYHYTANHFSEGALASLPDGIVPRSSWGGVQMGLVVWLPYVH
jgi:predicted porin